MIKLKIILLGAPGSGKGTQAGLLYEKLGIPHISTGEIFRNHIKNNTRLGQKAGEYMKAGQLVPDELTCEMLFERLEEEDCKNGFILDGFPRTINQAEALDRYFKEKGQEIDKVINIIVPDEEVNNWTPWIIANVMSVFLLNEYDQIRRAKALEKMLRCLDSFMDTYHDDGGCDEGTTYWGVAGGALFDCLDQLYLASDGKIDFFSDNLVRQIGRFIYRCHIADQYFINFADGSAKINVAKDMIYLYGKRIQDENMVSFAAGVPSSACFCAEALRRALPAVFNFGELTSYKSEPPYLKDVWMDGIQVMAAREKEGSSAGLYLAAKGGHNDESHNHNDVGSCIVFVDGLPGIIDIGVETYTKKTFSSQRYDIWTMQSQYHNVPTINGIMQRPGREYGASNVLYSRTDEAVTFSLDIQNAYPKAAQVQYYNRTYRMNRGKNPDEKSSIEITDTFSFENENNVISLNFMMWKKPAVIDDGCDMTELVRVSIDANTWFFMEYDKKNTKTAIEHCDVSAI